MSTYKDRPVEKRKRDPIMKKGFSITVLTSPKELEYSIDPNKPTTPDEVPRKSFLSYGTETMIPKL